MTDRTGNTGLGRDPRIWRTLALLLVLAAALSGTVDSSAIEHTDRVFARALLTLGAARGLDAAISLAQGTEIALQPAGMGLTVSAGEVLDPVNDLLEQFSSLMLVATTSLGLQGLLLRASSWWLLTAVFVVVVLARMALLWRPELGERWALPLGRVLVILFAVRFALPLFAVGSGLIFDQFLEPSRAEAVELLEDTTADVEEMDRLDDPEPADADQGWMGRVSGWFTETMATLDVEQRMESLRQRVAEVAEQVIYLLVVFALQTIVLPLAFLWIAPRLVGLALERIRLLS